MYNVFIIHYLVVLQLDVLCPQSSEPDKTEIVYSSSLKWIPQGNQEEIFQEKVDCVHSDIVIAKLKPGYQHKSVFINMIIL